MLKNQMSGLTHLYGHQVRQLMTTNLLSEFFRIHMLLTPLQLVLVLQYLTNPTFMVLKTLVRRHDRSFDFSKKKSTRLWEIFNNY